MTRLYLTTEIAAPPELCFDLALNVDVQRSLDGGMTAVAGVTSGALHLGETVTWRARHFELVWQMTTMIVAADRPRYFRDEMQRGPFASWRHEHQFLATSRGTRMIDAICFSAPLGPLGWAAEQLVLERYLRRLLTRRNRDLKALAERRAAA